MIAQELSIEESKAIVKSLREKNREAFSSGLNNAFCHILCDPKYEELNPNVYTNPIPHLEKNKILMKLLIGLNQGGSNLDTVLERINAVHESNGLLVSGSIAMEHRDVFRYILGALVLKTIEAYNSQSDLKLSRKEEYAIFGVLKFAVHNLGLRINESLDQLRDFVSSYESECILNPNIPLTQTARRAVWEIIKCHNPAWTLNEKQRLDSIGVKLKNKLQLNDFV